jgi:hypothetical protein
MIHLAGFTFRDTPTYGTITELFQGKVSNLSWLLWTGENSE